MLALAAIGLAAVVVGHLVVRIGRDGLGEVGDRALDVALGLIGQAAVVVGDVVLRD